jgi:hypothetical protein
VRTAIGERKDASTIVPPESGGGRHEQRAAPFTLSSARLPPSANFAIGASMAAVPLWAPVLLLYFFLGPGWHRVLRGLRAERCRGQWPHLWRLLWQAQGDGPCLPEYRQTSFKPPYSGLLERESPWSQGVTTCRLSRAMGQPHIGGSLLGGRCGCDHIALTG